MTEKRERSLVKLFAQGQRICDFQRPRSAEGGARNVAVFVGEGARKDQAVWGKDFLINKFAPQLGAAGHAHAVEQSAARATLGPPPVLEVLWIGPDVKHEVARGVKRAHNDEGAAAVVVVFRGAG